MVYNLIVYLLELQNIILFQNNEDKFINKPSEDRCKYITELISTVACPIDDWDIRKVCSDISIPHSHHKYLIIYKYINTFLIKFGSLMF